MTGSRGGPGGSRPRTRRLLIARRAAKTVVAAAAARILELFARKPSKYSMAEEKMGGDAVSSGPMHALYSTNDASSRNRSL